MAKPTIKLKTVTQRAELEVVKAKAEYLTNQRILQSQEAEKLREIEKKVVTPEK